MALTLRVPFHDHTSKGFLSACRSPMRTEPFTVSMKVHLLAHLPILFAPVNVKTLYSGRFHAARSFSWAGFGFVKNSIKLRFRYSAIFDISSISATSRAFKRSLITSGAGVGSLVFFGSRPGVVQTIPARLLPVTFAPMFCRALCGTFISLHAPFINFRYHGRSYNMFAPGGEGLICPENQGFRVPCIALAPPSSPWHPPRTRAATI